MPSSREVTPSLRQDYDPISNRPRGVDEGCGRFHELHNTGMRKPSAFAANRCLFGLVVLFVCSSRLPAQIPLTHAGRVLTTWLDAFNGADRAKMKAVLDADAPDLPLEQVMGLRARNGGYDIRKVQDSKEREIAMLVQEREGARQFIVINLQLDSDASDRFNIRLRPTEPPPEFAQPKMTQAEIDAAKGGAPFKALSAYIDALNLGERGPIQQFIETRYPSMNVNAQVNFAQNTGGFDLRSIDRATPTTVVGLVQERNSDQFARYVVVIDSINPTKIVQLGLSAIPRPAAFPIARLSEADLVTAVKSRLEKESAADRFSGTIAIAKIGSDGRKVLFEGAYGLADRDRKIANTLDTKFRIGSMNKMFTATSILQLVQAGKIKLTDPLGKYITDYPNKDVATKVTIHQLLTHTGGTGDIFGPEFDKNRLELRTLDDYVKLYGARGPQFEPGSRWEYSNYGMLLLGVVIERVTGQSYYDYVAEHVYRPAGMNRSGSEPEEKTVADRSVGYMKRNGVWTPNGPTLPYRGTSAGGGYSTVGDLLKFAEALLSHKLLNAEYTNMLITGKVDVGNGQMYAYGFEDGRRNGVGSVGHGGGAPGMNGELRIFPSSGYVIAVLANLDPPAASQVNGFIEPRLP
jgi:CubicO group peptidase (beta-lactamase class C family)